MPGTALTGQFCDGESALNSEPQTVHDQLANAKDETEMIERVEQYMVSKLKKPGWKLTLLIELGSYYFITQCLFRWIDWRIKPI